MNKFVAVSVLVIPLSGCGDSEESTTQKQAHVAKPSAYNPFAKEQQLIEDAKGIQNLLDQNADEKKQAVNSAN